jgi:hypothetical protein
MTSIVRVCEIVMMWNGLKWLKIMYMLLILAVQNLDKCVKSFFFYFATKFGVISV